MLRPDVRGRHLKAAALNVHRKRTAYLGVRDMIEALRSSRDRPRLFLLNLLHLVRSHEAPTKNSKFLGFMPQAELASLCCTSHLV